MDATTPLVGRQRELDELADRLARARDGAGSVLLLAGPPGIGKTALTSAAVRLAGERGVASVVGRALDDAAPPLWPWRPVLHQVGAPADAADDLTRASTATAEDAAATRFLALQRLADAVIAGIPAAGLLVVLEDVHWADATSLALLRTVAGRVTDVPLVVVATHRDVPRGDTGAFASELPRLLGQPAVTSVRLSSLAPDGVAALLARLDAATDDATLDAVVHATGGNPLFVRTVGRLLQPMPQEARTPAAVDALAGSREVRDAVGTWLRALPPEPARLLGLASVLGEEFAVGDLVTLSGDDPDDVLGLLDAAAEAEVIVGPDPAGRCRFSHAVVRDVLYAGLPTADRTRAHRRRAAQLAVADAPAAEVSVHALRGALDDADLADAATWAERAAAASSSALAWTDAAAQLEHALDAAERGHVGAGRRAELLVRLAEARYRNGDLPSALDACRRAADLAESCGAHEVLAAAALVVEGIGAQEVNSTLLDLTARALANASDAVQRTRLLAQRATALVHLDRTEEARRCAEQALQLVDGTHDPRAELDAVRASHIVSARPGQTAERTRLAHRALELAGQLGQPVARMWALLWTIDAAFEAGDLAAVDAGLHQLDVLAPTLGLPLARWHLHRLRAARCGVVGDFADARAECARARAVAAQIDAYEMVGLTYAFLLELGVLRGVAGEVAPDIDEVLFQAPPMAIIQTSKALTHLLHGRRDDAEALYRQVLAGLDELPVNGRWVGTVVQLTDLAIAFGDATGAERLCRLLLPAEPYCLAGPAGTVSSRGSAALVLGRLAAVAGRYDDALAHLARALDENTRSGARPYVAQTHLAVATTLVARGEAGDVEAARDAARSALAMGTALDMPGVVAPAAALLDTAPATGPLSARENEVVGLVAEGLTNGRIATRLVLSERTIESHVRNALLKLGLSRRAELVSWWLREGPGASSF